MKQNGVAPKPLSLPITNGSSSSKDTKDKEPTTSSNGEAKQKGKKPTDTVDKDKNTDQAKKADNRPVGKEKTNMKAKPSQVGPAMGLERTTIDYGTIAKGSDGVRKVKFTNYGSEPLVIKSGKGSCGCTVPTYPTEPILPGESAYIEIKYDTQRIGAFTKTVTLTTNEGEDNKVITIKGEVLAN
jgi:hypothetical protein